MMLAIYLLYLDSYQQPCSLEQGLITYKPRILRNLDYPQRVLRSLRSANIDAL